MTHIDSVTFKGGWKEIQVNQSGEKRTGDTTKRMQPDSVGALEK